MRSPPLLLCFALLGCEPPTEPAPQGVLAIVDPERGSHYFDLPFPSDTLLDPLGYPQLEGFPDAEGLMLGMVRGWVARVGMTTQGFSNNGAAYFRFEGPLELPETTPGHPDDPVLLVSLHDGSLRPLELRFVADDHGDPFYADNTLAMAPRRGFPMRSGWSYAAVIMRSAGVRAPDGYTLPDGVAPALRMAGVDGEPAVATTFTVQDVTGQLRLLADDADARLGDGFGVELEEVTLLDYHQGRTSSGASSTLATAWFGSGASNTAELIPRGSTGTHQHDLGEAWPMAVWEGELQTWNHQGLAERPYMSPGYGHIMDTTEYSGWIDVEAGALLGEPEPEPMRIVVALPRDEQGEPMRDVPVVLWDHGTIGHAYNCVQRGSSSDDGRAIAERFAAAGVGLICRDGALYGTRYPLIDEGFDSYLGFYNLVNMTAFRDNLRQTALDGHVLLRFVQQGLNDALPAGSIDPERLGRLGHSLGSNTANLGLAMDPDAYQAALLSGAGGGFASYFLETDLFMDIAPSLLDELFELSGAEMPADPTASEVIGAMLGLEAEAWEQVDRMHPVMNLGQWMMDPADALSTAPDLRTPVTLLMGIGDQQVPNTTTYALEQALAGARRVDCEVSGYDPHYCLFRDEQGYDALEDWLASW
jgi:hypothetical protein